MLINWKTSKYYPMDICNRLLFIIVIICFVFKDLPSSSALKFRRLSMPGAIQTGSPLWIHCDYDLENDKLYSVKLYKNSQEFYCFFVPENREPENKYYPQSGIHLDLYRSNASHVLLTKTDLNTEGTYSCEVTTSPTLQTFYKEKDLRIYVLPVQKQLQIVSHEWEYQIGDRINVTCISPPSRPSVSLAWYINGALIKDSDQQYKLHSAVVEQDSNYLIQTLLTIEFVVDADKHLANGVLTLQCSGLIWQIFGVPFEELAIEERGTVKPGRSTASGQEAYERTISDEDLATPRISSKRSRYQIGDVVDVNCVLKPVPSFNVYLEWFINDKPVEPSQVISYSTTDVLHQLFTGNHSDTAVSELRFRITKKHYQTRDKDNALKLRCLAIHGKVIWQDNIQLVLFDTSRQSSHLNLDSQLQITMWMFLATLLPFLIT